MLRERGVDVGLGTISLSETIVRAGVTRSTAYRSLADDELAPQSVLHREVLNQLLTRYSRADNSHVLSDVLHEELTRQADNLASDESARRSYALRSIIRVASNASYDMVVGLPQRSILTALYGALQSSGVDDWRLEALRTGEREITSFQAEIYLGLVEGFGFTLREPLTIEHFTSAVLSLIEGMAIRQGVNEHVETFERPTGLNGEMETWTLFAVTVEALIVGMFRPRDAEDAPVQPVPVRD